MPIYLLFSEYSSGKIIWSLVLTVCVGMSAFKSDYIVSFFCVSMLLELFYFSIPKTDLLAQHAVRLNCCEYYICVSSLCVMYSHYGHAMFSFVCPKWQDHHHIFQNPEKSFQVIHRIQPNWSEFYISGLKASDMHLFSDLTRELGSEIDFGYCLVNRF